MLDAAPGELRTLTGTLRRWTHQGRMHTAFERANDARGTIAELLASAGVHVPPPP